MLVAFLVSFLAIRTSARLTRSVSWWPGGVETGGVHLHHLVWGIGLMLLCGFLAFAAPLAAPWWHLIAIGFGVGAGFTLDEFALWVRLEDVYWAEEGRASFDAVVCTVAFGALVVIGTRPFGLDEPASIAGDRRGRDVDRRPRQRVLREGARAARRRRPLHPGRRARRRASDSRRPSSPWARWRYDDARRARAARRFAADRPLARTRRRAADLIAGPPTEAKEQL